MDAAADKLIGRTLADRYRIERVVAQEHLGKVYAARDLREESAVHVKVLHPSFVHDPKKFARFGREITATFLVAHPNTVEVLAWGQQDDLHWLVLEPLDAHALSEELARGPLDPLRAARIVAQVAAAIGAAHQEGIVHRAVVPRNVLVVDGSVSRERHARGSDPVEVKVRDFGMAKLESADEDVGTQTTLTTRVDELAYMAPEYLGTGVFLKKSDVYALGALAWHMLTGRPPPTGTGTVVVAPPPPSRVIDGVPPWLDALVVELLDTEPNRRPGAWKIVRRLEAELGEPIEPRAVVEPVAAPRREEPGAVTVVGGVALIVGALIVGGAVIVSSGVALLVTLWVAM